MRIFIAGFAMAALAAAPCAWDSDPREPPAIAALFANSVSPSAGTEAPVAKQDAVFLDEALHEEAASAFSR